MANTIALAPKSDLAKQIAKRADDRTGGIKQLAEGRSDVFKVNPFKIEVEEGFNVRDFNSAELEEHIDGLAQSIAAIGVKRPLTVRMKGKTLVLKDGECRLRATIRAIEVYGAEIRTIPVLMADRSESDADAALGILVENGGLAVSVAGKAEIVKRLINYGWSKEDIAAKAGMSKTRVIQLLEYNGLSDEVKGMVSNGTISSTEALNVARATGFDSEKTAETIREAATKVAASGGTKVTARALAPSLKATMKEAFTGAVAEFADDTEETVVVSISAENWEKVKTLLKL